MHYKYKIIKLYKLIMYNFYSEFKFSKNEIF